MIPGNPLVWSWVFGLVGAVLAISFGMCLALPVKDKKTYVIWSPLVFGLAAFLLCTFVMQTLDNQSISCVNQANGLKDLESCPSYGLRDALEITLIVSFVWFFLMTVAFFIGLLVTGGTALLEWAIDRIARILFATN